MACTGLLEGHGQQAAPPLLLPSRQAVIDWKWTRFCRKLLLWELAAFLLWATALYVFVAATQARLTAFRDCLLSLKRGTEW